MIIIGSDSEIMYFPPSFHFKKGLAKFTIEVRLIRGFRQKGAFSALSRGASYITSYTRVYTVMCYIKEMCCTIQHKSRKSFIIIKIIHNHLNLRVPKTLAHSELYRTLVCI